MNRILILLCICLSVAATTLSVVHAQTGDALLSEAELRGPAVAAVVELPRDTPSEKLSAVLTLLDLGEPDFSARLLKPLLAEKLNDEMRASLVGQFGTARLLRLARQDEAEFPGARKFVEACLKSASARAQDPKRLARLIADLNNDAAEVRGAAQTDLKTTGTAGAVACLETLAQTENERHRAELMTAIIALRPDSDPLLLAGLANGQGRFLRDLMELVSHSKMSASLPWLAHFSIGARDPANMVAARTALAKMEISNPTKAEVRQLLVREIERIESKGPPNETTWWWHQKTDKFASKNYSNEEIQTLATARFAGMILTCGRASPAERRLALVCILEGHHVWGLNGSPETMNLFSTDEVSSALAMATKQNRLAASLACIEEFESRSDRTVLLSHNGRPTPLSAALQSRMLDIRFAALQAVMKLAPPRGFAGSSHVAKSLWFFAGAKGKENSERANQALGWLAQLLEQGGPYDELLRDAAIASQTLYMPDRTEASLPVLQWAGTALSQQSLMEFASNNLQPLELRHKAVDAFAESIQRNGKLLTTTQIRQQYARYNDSKSANLDTQELLSKLLDLLEKK